MNVRLEKFAALRHPVLGEIPSRWFVVSANGRTIRSTDYETKTEAENFAVKMGWTVIAVIGEVRNET